MKRLTHLMLVTILTIGLQVPAAARNMREVMPSDSRRTDILRPWPSVNVGGTGVAQGMSTPSDGRESVRVRQSVPSASTINVERGVAQAEERAGNWLARGTLERFPGQEYGEVAGSSPATPSASAGRWRGPCSTWQYGENLTPARWAEDPVRGHRMISALITCVFSRWAPGNVSTALYVAERESSLYPFAQNPSSLCSGVFQHVLSAWDSRARTFLRREWFAPWVWLPRWSDPRANVIIAARMVAAGGWQPWSI